MVVRTGPATGREILLTAHYDAVVLPDGKLVDGVVDNAASVVAMIEATKRIAGRTKHPVRLLLTDQEELGLVGARAWITAHGVDNLAAVINADVNGNGDTLMYGLNIGDAVEIPRHRRQRPLRRSRHVLPRLPEIPAQRRPSPSPPPARPPSPSATSQKPKPKNSATS